MPRATQTAICNHCQRQFQALVKEVRKGHGQFCSRACSNEAQKIPIQKRFWSKVDISGGPNACWPWIAGRDGKGYGSIKFEGKQVTAHRVAFLLTYGRFPENLGCHSCDNPPCCNPEHIFDWTTQENTQDKIAKGRHIFGTKSPNAYLTDNIVLAIKLALPTHKKWGRYIAVAKQFGVSRLMVKEIAIGKRWRHITSTNQ